MFIDGYSIGGYWCLLMVIGGYFVSACWQLLMVIILVAINEYSMGRYW